MRNFLKTDHTTTDEKTRQDETGDKATSGLDTTQAERDERPAYPGLADEKAPAAAPAVDPGGHIGEDQPKPTFTPAYDGNFARATPDVASTADEPVTDLPADEPAAALPADEPVTAVPMDEPVVASRTGDEPVAAPAAPAAPATPATPATEDEPLFANTELMRASWQQVQAGFVDDPKAAVSDAANLIDVAVQALVETLRQRQRQLRDMSGNGTASGVSNPAGSGSAPDTEQLRLVMQRYRSLFNQLCS